MFDPTGHTEVERATCGPMVGMVLYRRESDGLFVLVVSGECWGAEFDTRNVAEFCSRFNRDSVERRASESGNKVITELYLQNLMLVG